MRIFFLFTTFILAGCGAQIEPEFLEYASLFEAEAASRKVQVGMVSIRFGEIGPAGARCNYNPLGREILVNRAAWEKADHPSRESILMHEFGHCLLDREHAEPTAKSIMRPTAPVGWEYNMRRSEFLDELFI